MVHFMVENFMLVLKSLYKPLLGLLVGICSLTCLAQEPASELVTHPLKDLRHQGSLTLPAAHTQVATIAMIFQPDCPWCKKQGKSLAELSHRCGHTLNLSLIGTKGDARQLKRELRHFADEIPALAADSQFLRLAGGIEASPTTLFFDAQGKLLLKKRGYIDEAALNQAATALTQGQCHS